ncbi:MAG: PAS domain S-box protein [Deltaproteobacteria bacterium]|nr:PAS domain S-box protein [Deltaproteobacteria bacterium]
MEKKSTHRELKQQISELKKEVKRYAAQNSDEKYRILFEKSKDAILIIENGKFVDCNQATVDMMGYKNKAELIQTHPSSLSPDHQPDGQDSFTKAKKMMDIALKNGSHRFEWDHMRANGEVFPVEVLLTTISHQEGNRVIHTIWRDITNRKQAEKARLEEKETLSTILESTPHGITLTDNQGKYLYVNPYFTKITGYTLKDIATKEDWFKKAYPDKDYRKKTSATWSNDSNHPGQGKNCEFKIRCKNGQSKYIEFRSTFLKDRRISVLTDVTSRKKSEEIIREKDRLQGVLELSGAVCHEMNQPLMSIKGYFDLILMDIPKDTPLYSRIDKIHAQIDRLSNITKKLMKISRYETKNYLKEKIVDLAKASTTENS